MRYPSLLACLMAAVSAYGLDTGHVPSEHTWVVDMNVRATMDGVLGEHVRARLDQDPAKARMSIFSAMTGLDALRDLDRVTISGAGRDRDSIVVAVRGRFDAERLNTLARSAPGHSSSTAGSRTVHTWDAPHRDGSDTGVLASPDLLIFARSPESLAASLACLDGSATAASFQNPWEGQDSLLLAISDTIVPAPGGPGRRGPQAALLNQLSGGSVRIMADAENIVFNAQLTGKDDVAARRFMDMANGLRAMLAVAADGQTDDENRSGKLTALLDRLTLQQNGNTIDVGLEKPIAEALECLDSLKEWKGRHHGRRHGDKDESPEAAQ